MNLVLGVLVTLAVSIAACRVDEGAANEGPTAGESARSVESQVASLAFAHALRDDPRDPALRPEARELILGQRSLPGIEDHAVDGLASLAAPSLDLDPAATPLDGGSCSPIGDLPDTIRIWRHAGSSASSSCSGRVERIPFESYIKGVLPHEWITSWRGESLRAGAIAIRTYALYWVRAGGKYDCADLDDTTASQVYTDGRAEVTNRAVDDTRGQVLVRHGHVVFAEYSAENGNPTADGVHDPLCAGHAVFGHGHGMCQWGSERWAQTGRSHQWIAMHYYPGATIVTVRDRDDDGVIDCRDNCPREPNHDQNDADHDHVGNACDNCPHDDNPGQNDDDHDGLGNACDNCPHEANRGQNDDDHDGVGNACDNCPHDDNHAQTDTDRDHHGDACDNDDDDDGVPDAMDNCRIVRNAEQRDTDGDGRGDACSNDDDGDGRVDDHDNCPRVENRGQDDWNDDGVGDACDDSDHDDVADREDNCRNVSNNAQTDLDADGRGDECDGDRDGDGVANETDDCADAANAEQADQDADGAGDVCDADRDGDGVDDDTDNCDTVVNADQGDADRDGVGDACDTTAGDYTLVADAGEVPADATSPMTDPGHEQPGAGAAPNTDATFACSVTAPGRGAASSLGWCVLALVAIAFGRASNRRRAVALAAALAIALTAHDARAQSVGQVANTSGCSTSGVTGLSSQLVQTQICMSPSQFERVDVNNVSYTSSRINRLMSRQARDAIAQAASHTHITVNSMFRTLADQYVLYESHACGLAARPGQSNHETGRAVDLANWSSVIGAMGAAGCRHSYPSSDPVHFDCPGPDYRASSIRAFQHLWNANHPGDRIAEDGVYGSATASRLSRSPAHGFDQSGCVVDRDDDGIPDERDNCPRDPNHDQNDDDHDGVGNACDNCRHDDNRGQRDDDHDGIGNACDNCPHADNRGQNDDDDDGVGNACDNCDHDPNRHQDDTDHDHRGDVCDGDDDGDGIGDANDNCPLVANERQVDTDGDGHGDACEHDDDGDHIRDEDDNCRRVANEDQADRDRDHIGDACDDSDDDGVNDDVDNCPRDRNRDQSDRDDDGRGDRCDGDLDGDGLPNEMDNCPNDGNADQSDRDMDALGDACDPDVDGDGATNEIDTCPDDANPDQIDSDMDGLGDRCDPTPQPGMTTDPDTMSDPDPAGEVPSDSDADVSADASGDGSSEPASGGAIDQGGGVSCSVNRGRIGHTHASALLVAMAAWVIARRKGRRAGEFKFRSQSKTTTKSTEL